MNRQFFILLIFLILLSGYNFVLYIPQEPTELGEQKKEVLQDLTRLSKEEKNTYNPQESTNTSESQAVDNKQEIMLDEDVTLTEDEKIPNKQNTNSKQEEDKSINKNQNKILEEKPVTRNNSNNLNQSLNNYVLNIISTYTIGNYPFLLNNDYNNYNGVTTNLYYQDKIIAKAHPSGNKACHCVGITFEVFFKAMQQRNQALGLSINNFNGMSWDGLHDFMLTWYVAKGDKTNSNVAVAVEKYGIGKRITNLEDAKSGDFIDISREDNTGHTAVFINWIKHNGQIIGVKYWSSQQSTNGINYNTEYFNVLDQNSRKYGNVRMDNVYIARIYPVSLYK